MGVPALFRWLSKKYPKIVEQVIEDIPIQKEVEGGYEETPIDMSQKNPNGMEFDNLYLDMNGIVHPCTHPEGKKPPESEAEMMVEIFKYTERVVSMVRPRKLLMIAIDGVAPRAKMNQQRSRRFRAAQEAKVKEAEKQALIEEYKLLGKPLSEDLTSSKKAWDSNAITPGTPFMTLLTESLRYWIVYKMNTDKGWSQIQVILSDASVPGEGEHKIMDFVRRQRTQSNYDPNTKHVIYGLDADLIMLSLATHEPHFKVLREDVFADQRKNRGCYTCGQPGHHSSQCQGKPKEKVGEDDVKQRPIERKPFIFLNVETLREYLSIELNIGGLPFAFDLERAIDDWVLLIFFVGNDFLPHIPSLEIREGAIDTLLRIWKNNLARMGGFLTDCGILDLKRTEVILEGLAVREDQIFRRRREAEERQDQAAKRRKIDNQNANSNHALPNHQIQPETGQSASTIPSLVSKSIADHEKNPDETGSSTNPEPAVTSLPLMSNADVVKNRFAIRTANMDAAALLKAELSGSLELSTSAGIANNTSQDAAENSDQTHPQPASPKIHTQDDKPSENTGGVASATSEPNPVGVNSINVESADVSSINQPAAVAQPAPLTEVDTSIKPENPIQKRKIDELESTGQTTGSTEEEVVILSEDEDEDEAPGDVSVFIPGQPSQPAPLKMLGNNMVEQEDTVKLWEPGYQERYYRQKFGLELNDEPAKRKIVKYYAEGLAWVLAYYYQGCQSWQWFYPYHYSPFAADFTNLEEFEIKFDLGQPFKPYEQLMGVFPAASRSHIPEVYHALMISDDSPIIDFYPEDFQIDMNGKKMLWQGIALLPFIEQDRLLSSMKDCEERLSEGDKLRNEPGDVVMFCGHAHPQYENFCKMYQKRDAKEPVTLDPSCANGVFGSALPDPNCIPGSTFCSPLPSVGLPDISNDKSIFARFFVPPQLLPHRSILLNGVKLERRSLNNHDREMTRWGGNQSHGGSQQYGDGFHQQRRDIGDGPGIMTNHYSGSNYAGAGHWNSYRGPPNHPSHPPSMYGNVYRNPAVPAVNNYRSYPEVSSYAHNGYGGHSTRGGYYGQRTPYARPPNYGPHHARGTYRPPHGRPTTTYYNPAVNRGNGLNAPATSYGGTGVGIPQRSSPAVITAPPQTVPYPSTVQSNYYYRGGFRPPGITPAVTRTVPNYPPQNNNPYGNQILPHPSYDPSSRR